MHRTQNGGVRRIKSLSKKRKSKSSSNLRRTKSQKGTPSGIITKYKNRQGEEKQLPKGPPNCIENAYDEKSNCLVDPVSLGCLKLSTVVQNPVEDKKCFDRDIICRWLRTKEVGTGDDPESRRYFPEGWIYRNCPIPERSVEDLVNERRLTHDQIIERRAERFDNIINIAYEDDNFQYVYRHWPAWPRLPQQQIPTFINGPPFDIFALIRIAEALIQDQSELYNWGPRDPHMILPSRLDTPLKDILRAALNYLVFEDPGHLAQRFRRHPQEDMRVVTSRYYDNNRVRLLDFISLLREIDGLNLDREINLFERIVYS